MNLRPGCWATLVPFLLSLILDESLAIVSLQSPHAERSPSQIFTDLASDCQRFGVTAFDVYGDFEQTPENSFLRRVEAEVARDLGMEDGVFMRSGVMTQSIALLIHQSSSTDPPSAHRFALHHSSHILLHEGDAYRELLHMEPVVVSTTEKAKGLHVPPMTLEDVLETLEGRDQKSPVSTLILELPHRELGGKLTPWQDVLQMSDFCRREGIRFHCDGARLFEAAAGYGLSLIELAAPFDSVYVSFYKGLGGISGAMLLGSKDFCSQARVWLRRFGGNLYSLLPYALAGWAGYVKYWRLEDSISTLSFADKTAKMKDLVSDLSADASISSIVTFDPEVPETNMVHGYLRLDVATCESVLDNAAQQCGIRILHRLRAVPSQHPAYRSGYRSTFEWSIGEANGCVDDETFLRGWQAFADEASKVAVDE